MKKELFTGLEQLHIVTPSQWLADLVKKSFLKKYPVTVIHNGIDTTVFKPTASDFRKRNGLEHKKIILGVASPWTARKGLQDFIKLSTMISDEWKIVLVGLSKKQLASIPKSILGIERTNNTKELAQIYTAADVFFNPTYEDNYPTTNLEAIACGTPVVTYDTGGSPESARQGISKIIEKGAINEALNFLIVSNLKGQHCTSRLIDKYRKFQEYLDIYHKHIG